MKKSKVINGMGMILTALAVIFLVRRMMALNVDFAKLITPVNIAMIVMMPFLSVMVIFINAYCWKLHLELFSKKTVEPGKSFRAYAQANVMKYLPGNIGHYAGRQLFGTEIGLKQAELIKASVLEIIYSTLSMLCCCVLFCVPNIIGKTEKWFTAGVGIFFIFASTVFYCLRKHRYASVCLSFIQSYAFWKTFLMSLLICSFGTILLAMEYVVLLGQYGIVDFHQMFILLSANYISVFIGFVTPGAPGGIGVREAVLIKMMSLFFREDLIILAAVTHRIILILGDLFAVPVSRMFVLCNQDEDKR